MLGKEARSPPYIPSPEGRGFTATLLNRRPPGRASSSLAPSAKRRVPMSVLEARLETGCPSKGRGFDSLALRQLRIGYLQVGEPASKAVGCHRLVGSNPALSATMDGPRIGSAHRLESG